MIKFWCLEGIYFKKAFFLLVLRWESYPVSINLKCSLDCFENETIVGYKIVI